MGEATATATPAYGCFAEPSYDPIDHCWHWPRDVRYFDVRIVGEPSPVVARPYFFSPGVEPAVSARRLDPEWQAARQVIDAHRADTDEESEDKRLDILSEGRLLATCSVRDKRSNRRTDVLLFPADPSRLELCLLRMHDQHQGWNRDRRAYLRVAKSGGEYGLWRSPWPICEIASGDGPGHVKGIFAIRTQTAILMLRARLGKVIDSSWTLSRLEVEVLQVVPNAQSPIVHIALNPWFASHMLSISAFGHWQICEAAKLTSASIDASDKHVISHGSLRKKSKGLEFWYTATWIHDTDTILLCSRQDVWFIDVPSQSSRRIRDAFSGVPSNVFIHGMQRDPEHADRAWILTDLEVICLRVDQASHQKSQDRIRARIAEHTLLGRFSHTRKASAGGLHISVRKISLHQRLLLLFAEGSRHVTILRVAITHADETIRTVASTPMMFTLPKSSSGPRDMLVLPSKWDGSMRRADADSLAGVYSSKDIHFAQTLLLSPTMDLVECMTAFVPTESRQIDVQPPTWHTRLHGRGDKLAKQGFITDGSSDDEADDEHTVTQSLAWLNLPQDRPGLNYEPVYKTATDTGISTNQDAAVAMLRIAGDDINMERYQLFSDIIYEELDVSSLDEAHTAFNQLLLIGNTSPIRDQVVDIRPIARSALLFGSAATSSQLDVRSLYAILVASWLSPLHQDIPGRSRLAREQLCRRIAVQLCLAANAIVPRALSRDTQDDDVSFLSVNHQTSSQHRSSPQPLSQTSALGALDQETYVGDKHQGNSPSAALHRLSRYTSFPHARPSANASFRPSRTITAILAHWPTSDPRATPETYSWLATTARLQAATQAEEDLSGLSERERQRVARKRARHEERKRREVEKYAVLRSSQATDALPEVTLADSRGSTSAAAAARGDGGKSATITSSRNRLVVRGRPPGEVLTGHLMRSSQDLNMSAVHGESQSEGQTRALADVSSQVMSQPQSQSQTHIRAAPSRKKVKRRAEGF